MATEARALPAVTYVLELLRSGPVQIQGRSMSYQPLGRLDPNRLPKPVQGLKSSALGSSDMATVVAALLYLIVGGLDEAHDLVTPLSWPSPTAFGATPPVLDSPAAAEATYVH
eukprot:RCo024653